MTRLAWADRLMQAKRRDLRGATASEVGGPGRPLEVTRSTSQESVPRSRHIRRLERLLAVDSADDRSASGTEDAAPGVAAVALSLWDAQKRMVSGSSARERFGRMAGSAAALNRHLDAIAAGAEEMGASIHDCQLTIAAAAAVEQQSATTDEMSRGVQEAAAESAAISAEIRGVASSAAESSATMTRMANSVDELVRLADRLVA